MLAGCAHVKHCCYQDVAGLLPGRGASTVTLVACGIHSKNDFYDVNLPDKRPNDPPLACRCYRLTRLKGGATEVVGLLEPFLSDIATKDRWGNTAMHVAAAGCNYELLKLLARRANLDIEKVCSATIGGTLLRFLQETMIPFNLLAKCPKTIRVLSKTKKNRGGGRGTPQRPASLPHIPGR